MRKDLGLFANIRPTFTFPSLINNSPLKKERIEGTDLVFLRELTGGVYFGDKGRKDGGKQHMTLFLHQGRNKRLAKKGFEMAVKRSKTLLWIRPMLETSRLWRETISEMEKDFHK